MRKEVRKEDLKTEALRHIKDQILPNLVSKPDPSDEEEPQDAAVGKQSEPENQPPQALATEEQKPEEQKPEKQKPEDPKPQQQQ